MPQRPPPCPARDRAALGPSFWEGGSKLLPWGQPGHLDLSPEERAAPCAPSERAPSAPPWTPRCGFSSTKLNYNGRDYSDISPALSKRLGVKGSVLERVRGAAIHTRELTVL